ncbi:MAG: hypothetical protein AAFX85_14955, partial [Pseudomonadota bacterium]
MPNRMVRSFLVSICLGGAVLATSASAQTIWSGFDFAFEKPNGADPLDPVNQDRMTDAVWLTRGEDQGLFNIRQEEVFSGGSPADTEWAFAGLDGNPDVVSAENFDQLNFTNWTDSLGGQGDLARNILDRDGVVHLISDDIYVDIRFTSWTRSAGGGGFAYLRGTAPPPPVEVGGEVEDLGLLVAICRNVTTGESVVAQDLMQAPQWSCTDAGLDVLSGERVLEVLNGVADCGGETCAVRGMSEGVSLEVVL